MKPLRPSTHITQTMNTYPHVCTYSQSQTHKVQANCVSHTHCTRGTENSKDMHSLLSGRTHSHTHTACALEAWSYQAPVHLGWDVTFSRFHTHDQVQPVMRTYTGLVSQTHRHTRNRSQQFTRSSQPPSAPHAAQQDTQPSRARATHFFLKKRAFWMFM